jgi:mono/diheme cytochrome c family protein
MRSVTSHAILAASIALVSVIGVKAVRSTEVVAASASKAAPGSGERDDCDEGSPIEGRRIFVRENCYSCHGGLAGGGFCPSLRGEDRPDESDVEKVLEEGTENGMPRFPHLRERDAVNLCAYFQSLGTQREPTFTHWWEPVPTQ